jgi:hypothetical protein
VGLTRREALHQAVLGAGLAFGLSACGGSARPQGAHSPAGALARGGAPGPAHGPGRRLPFVLDVVFDNPGQPPTRTSFKDPRKLAVWGYDGQVVADWRPPTTAITYDSVARDIFPRGSSARGWVERNAREIERRTEAIHAAGLKALYHTDMIVFPTRLVERYGESILDASGSISLQKPMTRELLRVALAEIFARFPALDGLVIRTGEVYLQDLPYHTGSDPIVRGPASHLVLLDLLRAEACVKRDKLILYRTWAFDGFTSTPAYYLSVAEHVRPHPLLAFAIKHTDGDFWRTVPFNPTLGLGRHQQIVEVECQREYEGKGAHPNYIAHGVIEGFEELGGDHAPIGLAGLAGKPTFAGVLTWSRGGGWNGPYITDELWCALNAYVLSRWAQGRGSEAALFDEYAAVLGLDGPTRTRLRRLALLSATGVLHGHYSTVVRLQNLAWTRDEYLGGSDLDLARDFAAINRAGRRTAVLAEKGSAASTWLEVVKLADGIVFADPDTTAFARLSSRYGALLYGVIANAWGVMLWGLEGDRTGRYNRKAMAAYVRAYDAAWDAYRRLSVSAHCPTLYVPYSFRAAASPRQNPTADPHHGMAPSIQRYRRILAGSEALAAGASTSR